MTILRSLIFLSEIFTASKGIDRVIIIVVVIFFFLPVEKCRKMPLKRLINQLISLASLLMAEGKCPKGKKGKRKLVSPNGKFRIEFDQFIEVDIFNDFLHFLCQGLILATLILGALAASGSLAGYFALNNRLTTNENSLNDRINDLEVKAILIT